MGAVGQEEQNKEAEVCRTQRHQTLEGGGRIHLDRRSTGTFVAQNQGDIDNAGYYYSPYLVEEGWGRSSPVEVRQGTSR